MLSQLRDVLAYKGATVFSVDVKTRVPDAAREMTERRIGALLVTSEGAPVGIFSERDILQRVVAVDRAPGSATVAEVMTRRVAVVRGSVTVEEAMAICTEKRVRHLPVVEDGKVVAMVSSGDLARWLSRDRAGEIQQLVDYISGRYPG